MLTSFWFWLVVLVGFGVVAGSSFCWGFALGLRTGTHRTVDRLNALMDRAGLTVADG